MFICILFEFQSNMEAILQLLGLVFGTVVFPRPGSVCCWEGAERGACLELDFAR